MRLIDVDAITQEDYDRHREIWEAMKGRPETSFKDDQKDATARWLKSLPVVSSMTDLAAKDAEIKRLKDDCINAANHNFRINSDNAHLRRDIKIQAETIAELEAKRDAQEKQNAYLHRRIAELESRRFEPTWQEIKHVVDGCLNSGVSFEEDFESRVIPWVNSILSRPPAPGVELPPRQESPPLREWDESRDHIVDANKKVEPDHVPDSGNMAERLTGIESRLAALESRQAQPAPPAFDLETLPDEPGLYVSATHFARRADSDYYEVYTGDGRVLFNGKSAKGPWRRFDLGSQQGA